MELPAVNPLAQAIRDAAAAHPDPKEVESLLRSAEKVEEADRKFKQASEDLVRSIERAKAMVEESRRKDHVPGWVVALVLVLFVATLAAIARKHYF